MQKQLMPDTQYRTYAAIDEDEERMLPELTAFEPSPVVLVVENDVLKRLALGSELRGRGLQVLEAGDATEVKTVLEKVVVDVILSDVSLLQAAELEQWVSEHQLPTRFFWTAKQRPGNHRDSGSPDRLYRHHDSLGMSVAGRQQAEHACVVLIVEDDVLLRLATASSLRDAGFEILETANAADAVIVLNALLVDALISDVDIPGRMDGLALAKWVQDRGLSTKVVLTCAAEQSQSEAHDHAYFLAKPYDGLSVQRILRKVLTH
jgi:two-component system, response regulator PdtaR